METILIVDDDKDFCWNLSNLLKGEKYKIIVAHDGKKALLEVEKKYPDLVLLDLKLPNMDGMEILDKMKQFDKDLVVIMLTGLGDAKSAVNAMKLGAFDYIIKPFDSEELILIIKKAFQTRHLVKEVESLKMRLGEKRLPIENIMGSSSSIKKVLEQIKIVAPTNMTIILQGESGTGKELIGSLIHEQSSRKDKPFVAVDCGTIPETLVESELFGYEKGAFTGADEKREGKFEQANSGTLFLDEITNLPFAMQAKFLRAIQERKVQHLGGKKDIKIDIRIIVATNTKLPEAVKAGKFRDDLFHRLNEFAIELPLLRERKEDLPVLVGYFLNEANLEFNKRVKNFSEEAMMYLINYYWPGNIRELKNVVKRAVLLAEGDYVAPANLPVNVVKPQESAALLYSEADSIKTLFKEVSLEDMVRNFERDLIKKALEQVGGNKIEAAEVLCMNRKTLYRKIKNLGI